MAAEKGFGFDADSVKRISKVVRRVEREYPNPSPKRGRRVPQGGGKFKAIVFTLPSALSSSDASKASCTVTRVISGTSPGATVTVQNELGFAGDTDGMGYAVWDPTFNSGAGGWLIWQLECITDEVVS